MTEIAVIICFVSTWNAPVHNWKYGGNKALLTSHTIIKCSFITSYYGHGEFKSSPYKIQYVLNNTVPVFN